MGTVLDLVAEHYSLLELWLPGDTSSATPSKTPDRKDRGWGGSARDWIQPVYSCDLNSKMGYKFLTGLVNTTESFQNQLPTEVRVTNACHHYSGFIMKDVFFL